MRCEEGGVGGAPIGKPFDVLGNLPVQPRAAVAAGDSQAYAMRKINQAGPIPEGLVFGFHAGVLASDLPALIRLEPGAGGFLPGGKRTTRERRALYRLFRHIGNASSNPSKRRAVSCRSTR